MRFMNSSIVTSRFSRLGLDLAIIASLYLVDKTECAYRLGNLYLSRGPFRIGCNPAVVRIGTPSSGQLGNLIVIREQTNV